MQLHPEVPFFMGMPIFTTKTDVPTVEQALRDFRSVGIVDTARNAVHQIRYGNGHVQQDLFTEANKVLLLRNLDPNVHVLIKHAQSPGDPDYPIRMPAPLEIDHLPHVRSVPVLTRPFDSLGHMLTASRTGERRFWYLREGHDHVLIQPRMPSESAIVRVALEPEVSDITRVLTRYGAHKLLYGEALASVLDGAAIPLNGAYAQKRMSRIVLPEYPRFGKDATRAEMIQALQTHGRFRFYDSTNRLSDGPIKVKLENAGAQQGTPMDITVERLSGLENKAESFYEKVGRIRRPG